MKNKQPNILEFIFPISNVEWLGEGKADHSSFLSQSTVEETLISPVEQIELKSGLYRGGGFFRMVGI